MSNALAMLKKASAASAQPAAPAKDSPLARLSRAAKAMKGKPSNPEIYRILQMPVIFPMTDEEVEEFNANHINAKAFREGRRLWRTQCEIISAYETFGGRGFGDIGCGHGKTNASIMIASSAYRKGLRKIVLFVPASVYGQLMTTDIPAARTWLPVVYPIHGLGNISARRRAVIAESDHPGLYVFPYSILSRPDSEDLLYAIGPQLVIADEAHCLANADSARTKRYRKYQREMDPEFVPLSGTITTKSLKDYHHLASWSLDRYSFLPNTWSDANLWAYLIDADADSKDGPASEQEAEQRRSAITLLRDWAARRFPREDIPYGTAGFRKAYMLRKNSTPGVVCTGDAEVKSSLLIKPVMVQDYKNAPGFADLQKLLDKVEKEWTTPSGDELEYAIHVFKWLYELGSGFYNELFWPDADTLAKRKGYTVAQAEKYLELAKERHASQQEYHKILRKFLQATHIKGLDTPMLVGLDMSKNGAANVPRNLYEAWKEWHDQDFDECPDRDSRSVRVCDYKIRHALNMAKKHGPGIIWVHNIGLGEWAAEIAQEMVLDALHCPAGEQHNRVIGDRANKDKIIIASISAHGTGKNLQHFSWQYFLQWPRPAKTAEQTLARLHRNGQKADEVEAMVDSTLLFDQMLFAACLNDSLYIHQSTGSRQKLIYATYDPLPKIFPQSVLQERGTRAMELTTEQQRMLADKFGA